MLDRAEEQLLDEHPDALWELFHENSKASRYERHAVSVLWPSDAAVVRAMQRLRTVKAYDDHPALALPTEIPASRGGFDDLVLGRTTARSFDGGGIELAALAKILHFAYGITRDNAGTAYPRPFRAVPSGGALYPLEVYVHARRVDGLRPGLHHFDPERHVLVQLPEPATDLAACFIQPELLLDSAVTLLVTATFFRSTFKYGDRGYRFALLEAGHLAHSALLTATDLGLAAAPIGGFLDRDVDRYLGIDGVDESIVYAVHVGTSDEDVLVELDALPEHQP